jgi:iron(III) transport system permease protein
MIAVMPLVALLAASLAPALGVPLRFGTATLANYRFALLEQDATLRAFANSLLLAFTTALVSAAVALPLAYFATLRQSRTARVLDAVAAVPYAVPGTVLAIAIILSAYLARFLALVLRPTMAAMGLINKNLDEAAQIAGAPLLLRLRAVILPSVAPSVMAGALLIFMSALNELTVSALLWSTGRETLGVVVFALQYEGNSPAAAAVATISVALTLGLAMVATTLSGKLPEGVVPWQA